MRKLCVFQGHAKEIEIDGGVVQVYLGYAAGRDPETLAYRSKRIFTFAGLLAATLDERHDTSSPLGEIE